MSPDTITGYYVPVDGRPARAHALNQNFSNMRGSLIPIHESTATAATDTYDLGDSTRQWKRAYISTGYWHAGDIKAHHSYAGSLGPGHGWMLCDGRQVTEAAYNTEHGANTWATYIGSSTLLNKYLPDFRTNTYMIGVSATTHAGGSAITLLGNLANTVSLTHGHGINPHRHIIINASSNQTFSTYDVSGAAIGFTSTGGTTGGGPYFSPGNVSANEAMAPGHPGYTLGETTSSDNQLSASQSIQPDSIEVKFYMRII